MNSLKKIFIIIFIPFIISASEKGITTISYETNDIVFSAEMQDSFYTFEDTVVINYEVQNNSDKIIYTYNPEYQYSNPIDLESPVYNIGLGGDWFYNLGYGNSIFLLKLNPKENFKFKFLFVLKDNNKYFPEYVKLVRTPYVDETRLIRFNTSCLPELKNIKIDLTYGSSPLKLRDVMLDSLIDWKNQGYFDIQSAEVGINIEIHLQRSILGLFEIKIIDRKQSGSVD